MFITLRLHGRKKKDKIVKLFKIHLNYIQSLRNTNNDFLLQKLFLQNRISCLKNYQSNFMANFALIIKDYQNLELHLN